MKKNYTAYRFSEIGGLYKKGLFRKRPHLSCKWSYYAKSPFSLCGYPLPGRFWDVKPSTRVWVWVLHGYFPRVFGMADPLPMGTHGNLTWVEGIFS